MAMLITAIPLLGFFISIVVSGYVSAYMMDVIVATADGETELPDLPGFTDFGSDVLYPLLLVVGTGIFCLLPAIILWVVGLAAGYAPPGLLWKFLLVVSALYAPMAFTAVALFRSLAALNPAVVLPAMSKVGLEYVTACVLLALVVAGRTLIGKIMPGNVLLRPLIEAPVGLYFLAVEMHILGLMYYTNRDKLGWFRPRG